jgi:hypothetical protein
MFVFMLCCSGGDDFEEVDEDENIDEIDQQEVRPLGDVPVSVMHSYRYHGLLPCMSLQ